MSQSMYGKIDGRPQWVDVDDKTAEWFNTHPFDPDRSVVKCPMCGVYYHPKLGHECKVKGATGRGDIYAV